MKLDLLRALWSWAIGCLYLSRLTDTTAYWTKTVRYAEFRLRQDNMSMVPCSLELRALVEEVGRETIVGTQISSESIAHVLIEPTLYQLN